MIDKDFFVEEKFVSEPGSRYRDLYTPDIAKDGTIELIVTGKEDTVELMNSFKDAYDPAILAERFLAGDVDCLNRGNPVFMDVLGAPKNLAEAYALNFRAENAFNMLPSEVKAKFDNSYYKFVEVAGTPEWYDSLKMSSPDKSESDVIEGVIDDAEKP